jgi:hypothetical protein
MSPSRRCVLAPRRTGAVVPVLLALLACAALGCQRHTASESRATPVAAPSPSAAAAATPQATVSSVPYGTGDPMAELSADAFDMADKIDTDRDAVMDSNDNCVDISNADQKDRDRDGYGDACDPGETRKPRVRLVSPRNGARFEQGQPIRMRAEASDPDGTISEVYFVIRRLDARGSVTGGSNVGAVTEPPYELELPWSVGRHQLTAHAFDNHGAKGQSSPVTITVSPTTQHPPQ